MSQCDHSMGASLRGDVVLEAARSKRLVPVIRKVNSLYSLELMDWIERQNFA